MFAWSIGTALALGWEPASGLPALGADVLPLEVRVRRGDHALAAQLDWSQAVASAALSRRATVGVAAFWEREPHPNAGWRAGPGLEIAAGRTSGASDGHLVRAPAWAAAPAARVGWSTGGSVRVEPALRGAIGVRGGDGVEPWLRALVEVSVVAGGR